MKTGIFIACAGKQDGGPETYERHLVENIAKIDRNNEYHVFCFNQEATASIQISQDNFKFHTLWPNSRWLSLPVSLPICLAKSDVSLYHATFIPTPFSPVPCVFTMHDVSPFTHPHFYPKKIRRRLTALLRSGLEKSKHIICISQNCLETTADYFSISKERMSVVHHGVNPELKPMEKSQAFAIVHAAYNIHEPFLLYLGKLEARKNIAGILEAYHQYQCETPNPYKLVLAGRRFWDLHGIDETIDRLGLRENVLELGYIPQEHVAALYSAAEVFLFPTLWEGFGFPVLEAMACGTPVITSAVSCLPEIAGDAAIFVDPADTEEIAAAIQTICTHPEIQDDLSQKGLERVREFSWEKTAKETISAYEKCV